MHLFKLNVGRTKELNTDFRGKKEEVSPVIIKGQQIEIVQS